MKCEQCGNEYPSKHYFSTPSICKECFHKRQSKAFESTPMQCLECKSQLIEKCRFGITIDECEQCKGIWFDAGELEAYGSVLGEKKESAPTILADFEPEADFAALVCPRCLSESVKYGSTGELKIACCAKCAGIFVSNNELLKFSERRRSSEGTAAAYVAEGKVWIGTAIIEFLLEILDL